jgi:hypothetical protein
MCNWYKLQKSFVNQYWIGNKPVSVYTFSIEKSFKGLEVRDRLISILAPIGYQYAKGFCLDSTYLVFGLGSDDNYPFIYTHDCTNTCSINSGDAAYYITKLGEPVIHEKITDYDLQQLNYYSKSATNDSLSQQTKLFTQESINQNSSIYKLKLTLKILIVALGLLVVGCFYYFYRKKKISLLSD